MALCHGRDNRVTEHVDRIFDNHGNHWFVFDDKDPECGHGVHRVLASPDPLPGRSDPKSGTKGKTMAQRTPVAMNARSTVDHAKHAINDLQDCIRRDD